MDSYIQPALRLHQHIVKKHWNGAAIVGPDPIGKINWRVTRFLKSYLPWFPGEDRYTYLQGQAYWIQANLALFQLTQETHFLDLAGQCTDYIVQKQPDNGAWLHPPIRWRVGFISTVEGVWASLGLIAAYKTLGKQSYLDSALKWYEFQISEIGFQPIAAGLVANYYSHSKSKVPNVTTMLIWLTAELVTATGDKKYLEYTDKMIRFIEYSQLDSGELPYALGKPHFMCYQYNSFQFLDLAYYYELTNDVKVLPILEKMTGFLATGVTERGSCCYNCFRLTPEVNYWTAAIATALSKAQALGLGDYAILTKRAYEYMLAQQREDGGFAFSLRNYKLLRDERSYPRYQAMILKHLLSQVQGTEDAVVQLETGLNSFPHQ